MTLSLPYRTYTYQEMICIEDLRKRCAVISEGPLLLLTLRRPARGRIAVYSWEQLIIDFSYQ